MSRGLGKIERAILDALEKEASKLSPEDREHGVERNIPMMDTRRLLIAIHGDLRLPNFWAKYNAITRALRSLGRKELVASFTHKGRTIWTDPQGAAELEELGKIAQQGLAHLQQGMASGKS